MVKFVISVIHNSSEKFLTSIMAPVFHNTYIKCTGVGTFDGSTDPFTIFLHRLFFYKNVQLNADLHPDPPYWIRPRGDFLNLIT